MYVLKFYSCMKGDSQPDDVAGSIQAPKKSSSKSSLKSKSSKTSIKSVSGSTVSVKNEAATEVMQCYYIASKQTDCDSVFLTIQLVNGFQSDQAESDPQATVQPPKSCSRSSVISKSSRTSLKSTSAAQETDKNEISPEVSY